MFACYGGIAVDPMPTIGESMGCSCSQRDETRRPDVCKDFEQSRISSISDKHQMTEDPGKDAMRYDALHRGGYFVDRRRVVVPAAVWVKGCDVAPMALVESLA